MIPMAGRACPNCGEPLSEYPKYFYCWACSKQFKAGFFGKLKEIPRTIEEDAKKAMGGK